MSFNPLISNEIIHRKRDKDLSEKWKQEHDDGICGGLDNKCHVCAKNELFDLVRDVLTEQENIPH